MLLPQCKDQKNFERKRNKFPNNQNAFVLQPPCPFSDLLEIDTPARVSGVKLAPAASKWGIKYLVKGRGGDLSKPPPVAGVHNQHEHLSIRLP